MRIDTYLQNGTTTELDYLLNDNDKFSIQYMNGPTAQYFYPGDSIVQKVDMELVILYDALRNHFFEDTSQYYNELSALPIFVRSLGLDADDDNSKDLLPKLIRDVEVSQPNLYKHLYLADAQFIVSSIQNLVIGMNYDFIDYFKRITQVRLFHKINDGLYAVTGEVAAGVVAMLGSYYVKAHSVLDLITKVAFELESKDYNFTEYCNLRCAKILYGDKKRLNINNSKGTLFIKDDFISEIESVRNEIVHNGTWENNPKVFCRVKDNTIVERFVYYPDMIDGHYTKFVNRYHFFSSGKKVNDLLPIIHLSFLNRLLITTLQLCNPEAKYGQILSMI